MTDPMPTDRPLLGLDTETTGVDPTTCRIIELAILYHDPTDHDDPAILLDSRLNHGPDLEIPTEASDVHGITAADLTGAPDAAMVLGTTLELLHQAATIDVPVVIYNAPYDLGALAAEAARHDLGPIPPGLTVLDPLVLDRHYDRWRKGSRTLTANAQHYGVPLDDAHAARADVAASLAIARAMLDRYEIPNGREALHRLQADAHAEWARSFADYLARTAPHREPPDTTWLPMELLR